MRIYESMFRRDAHLRHGEGEYQKITIRVWRTETEARAEYDQSDLAAAIQKLLMQQRGPDSGISLGVIAERIADMPRVAAVEVLNMDGSGPIIYSDWP